MNLLKVICLAAVVVVSAARAQNSAIEEQSFDNDGIGPWSWGFSSSDGTSRQESGKMEDGSALIRGSVTWKDPEGKLNIISYIGDKSGYRMKTSHRPTKDRRYYHLNQFMNT